MSAPLFQNAPRPSAGSNVGLVFDKYFASWNDGFLNALLNSYVSPNSNIEKYNYGAKADWVKKIAERGAKASPGDAAKRLAALAAKLGGKIWYVVAVSRFVTGTGIANPLENGFAFHHTLGVPYLAASGLKGAIRNYWTQWHDPKLNDLSEIDRLLGSAKSGVGSVIFFDMLPIEHVKLVPEVMTPHYSEWYQDGKAPGDWMSPTPIPFIAVEAGAIFQIAAAPRVFDDQNWPGSDCKILREILEKTLDITGIGAKTAVDYGRFLLCDNQKDARAAAEAIATALRAERTPQGGQPPASRNAASSSYRVGDTLPAGKALTWNADGEEIDVITRAAILLAPKTMIPISYDGVEDDAPIVEDDAPISQIVELKHIK